MLHEYHAQMMSRERERHLREVSELARLHRDVTRSTRPSWWARWRRRAADAREQAAPRRRPQAQPQPQRQPRPFGGGAMTPPMG